MWSIVGTIAVKQRPSAANPHAATNTTGSRTGSSTTLMWRKPAACSPVSTADTITTYMVESSPAQSTSPQTTCGSATCVVSWPSHVR
jgi:hypothetical protein